MAYSILKNANCAPAEVELLNEIARVKETLAHTEDEAARQTLQHTLTRRQTRTRDSIERRSRNAGGMRLWPKGGHCEAVTAQLGRTQNR